MTSSTMPIVKWFLGLGFLSSSKTTLTIAGVNSLDDETVSSGNNHRLFLERADVLVSCFPEGSDDIEIERVSDGARLFELGQRHRD